MSTFDLQIGSSGADTEETVSTGAINATGLTLDLGREHIGLYFPNVTVAQGATINSCYIEFVADASDSAALTLDFYFQDSDDAPALTTTDFDLSGRTARTTVTQWTPGSWTGGIAYQSVDLAASLQEVIDRPGWASGNALVVIVDGDGGSERRRAKSYDNAPGSAALLHVDYTADTYLESAGDIMADTLLAGAAFVETFLYPAGAVLADALVSGAGTANLELPSAGAVVLDTLMGGVPFTYTELQSNGTILADALVMGVGVAHNSVTSASRNAAPAHLAGAHIGIEPPGPVRLAGAKLNNGL